MSLKRRNIIALVLLLSAAAGWTFGQQLLDSPSGEYSTEGTEEETYFEQTYTEPGTEIAVEIHTEAATEIASESEVHSDFSSELLTEWETEAALGFASESMTEWETEAASEFASEPAYETESEMVSEFTEVWTDDSVLPGEASGQNGAGQARARRFIGFLLSFAAVVAAGAAIFALFQKNPICGPDGIFLLFAAMAAVNSALQGISYRPGAAAAAVLLLLSGIVTVFLFLTGIRELLGWMRFRLSLSWCLVQRIARRCRVPQVSLLVLVGWILLSLSGFSGFLAANAGFYAGVPASSLCCLAAAALGFCCLWKYGADLGHFKRQLDNYRKGLPIAVGDGAFAQTEAQLLDVQARHEEAVRTAVTSERFKVELISNVSHDLRTPLTAILGYSELLQRERLSPEGQEQLRRLHQKAGYMNDLVGSLFELTKVSSGVAEAKKEEIDLIRLLEQTIGLFDDQLTAVGLAVRRSYCSDTVPVVTDGGRMHQVFANLLGNAIKYALAGTRIYLEVRQTEKGCLVRMTNTASYEMDFQPDEIVQRFARGDKARSTKGSGLGLAIAQTYTASVGGSFRVAVDGDQFNAIVELPR